MTTKKLFLCPMLSYTEENYLKALFYLTDKANDEEQRKAGNNELALHLNVKPATVNDMLKKLKQKKLIDYEKYGKINLTEKGRKIAVSIVRKHRLWETFLCEKLGFNWDEVHELAEQLEHIQSDVLIDRLDEYLNFPKADPHGDPIPKRDGFVPRITSTLLSAIESGKSCKVIAVKDTSASFLQYLQKLSIGVGTSLKVKEIIAFDESVIIQIDKKNTIQVSKKFADSLLVG